MAEVQACKRTSLWIDAWACFLSQNVETAAFGELFQLLYLQNYVITSLASSLLKMGMDFISWKTFFFFSCFDSHLNVSHTNIYLNEREFVLLFYYICYFIIFVIYYFKVFMFKHHSWGFYLYTGLFYMWINEFALISVAFQNWALFKKHPILSVCAGLQNVGVYSWNT